jgi:hypothetical protein
MKCYFFLDTIFRRFYTFVNCKESLAGSMSTRQRENRNNGNQESSSKEASEEGSQEGSKKEVSRQRNRQHNRGTPKASPDVLWGEPLSPVFMGLWRASCPTGISLAKGTAGRERVLSLDRTQARRGASLQISFQSCGRGRALQVAALRPFRNGCGTESLPVAGEICRDDDFPYESVTST